MLNRLAMFAAAGILAFALGTFAGISPAEAGGRHHGSSLSITIGSGYNYGYYKRRYQPYYYRHHRPRYYRHYYKPPRRAHRRHHARRGNRCHQLYRWAVRNTSDPKMQARILRHNGC